MCKMLKNVEKYVKNNEKYAKILKMLNFENLPIYLNVEKCLLKH